MVTHVAADEPWRRDEAPREWAGHWHPQMPLSDRWCINVDLIGASKINEHHWHSLRAGTCQTQPRAMTPPGSDKSAVPTPRPRTACRRVCLASKECLVTVQLDHTIVSAKDKRESATFLAEVLGVAPPTTFGPFLVVTLDNGVSLDFLDDYGLDDRGHVHPQHYAFLVTETEFDDILGRIARAVSPPGPTLGRPVSVRSTPTTGGAASTGRTPAGTSWRSSLAPMAASVDRRGCAVTFGGRSRREPSGSAGSGTSAHWHLHETLQLRSRGHLQEHSLGQ